MEFINHILEHPVLSLVPDFIVYGLVVYMFLKMLDFLSGLTRTWTKKEQFKSSIMREGIGRWVGEIIGLSLVIIIDLFFGLKWALTTALLLLLTVKEIGSVKENLNHLGVTLPAGLDGVLDMLTTKAKGGGK